MQQVVVMVLKEDRMVTQEDMVDQEVEQVVTNQMDQKDQYFIIPTHFSCHLQEIPQLDHFLILHPLIMVKCGNGKVEIQLGVMQQEDCME